ncbi:MAG TPA: hypothetical protein VMS17_08955 [Gemmataceae bacterium]|nr:hypothetical protein [Gemmataceae bacterium]
MILSLIVAASLVSAPESGPPSGMPPQQALAIVNGEGVLKITQIDAGCFPSADQDVPVATGPMGQTVTVKVKTTTVQLTTVEFPAKYVEAYTVDGATIAREKLGELLVKERPVLVAIDGKKIDPFHLQLFKEGTIVLVPPVGVLGGAGGPFVGVQSGLPIPPPAPPNPAPAPERKP